jgi:hypothetical protein
MTAPAAPAGLASGGLALWNAVTGLHELAPPQLATLELACRQRDRCDALAPGAAAADPGALRHERDSALAMPRLLAALRLVDEAGRKPQSRQLGGVQEPAAGVTPVSALDRARLRHGVRVRVESSV